VEYSSTPRYENGQLTCSVLAFRDITQRRESEKAERWEQQQRFRAVFEQAAVGIALVRMDGVCLQVNDRLCRILGRPPETLLETPFHRLVHPDDQPMCSEAKTDMIRDAARTSNVLEVRCTRADNELVWVQLALSLVRDQSSAPMYCVLVVDDITERKLAETALLRSQGDLQRSQRIARLGSWELNLHDLNMNWSEEAMNILGRTMDVAPDLLSFLSATHPDDYADVQAAVEGWFAGRGRKSLEYRIVRPDGEPRFVDLSVRFERDEDGSPSRVVGTIQDISERKRTEQVLEFYRNRLEQLVEERTAELRASNRDLASANRELEAFSYSVSHDLRSPLRAINGFTQALEEDYGDKLDEEALGYIGRVQNATVRMGELIDGLLNLSRVFRSEFDAEPVDLSTMAGDLVRQLKAADTERRIEVDIDPNLIATGDPTLLRLLLQNLMGNAWKFTADTPGARITFGRETGEAPDVFYVRDNGVGFEMEYAHQLFQPFHRLHAHDEYDGTGIGLATVRRIVQRHGGRVWAEGKPNAGATIRFTLEPEACDHPLQVGDAASGTGGS
jgi:PAS domain S-box-containing protein